MRKTERARAKPMVWGNGLKGEKGRQEQEAAAREGGSWVGRKREREKQSGV